MNRLLLFLCWWLWRLSTTATIFVLSSSSSGTTGIPRSARATTLHLGESDAIVDGGEDRWTSYPPWNPSRNITESGFLCQEFYRIPGEWEKEVRLRTCHTLERPCRIRQVPGDGNCLFHSLSLCLCYAQNGTHWDMKENLYELYLHSRKLRRLAVQCLQENPYRRLVLQGGEVVSAQELVHAAAAQYGLTSQEYCQDMLQEAVWGGGPEIVALANVLKRPIHVYELVSTTADGGVDQFRLRRMACFGSPRFDVRGQDALHILSADSRFPDIAPGRQLPDGNHFLAVFPIYSNDDEDGNQKARRRKRLRGGSFWGIISKGNDDNYDEDIDDAYEQDDSRSQKHDYMQHYHLHNTNQEEVNDTDAGNSWLGKIRFRFHWMVELWRNLM